MGTRWAAGVLFLLFGLVTRDAWPSSRRDGNAAGESNGAPSRKSAGLEIAATGNSSPVKTLRASFPGSIRPCIPQPEVCNFRDDNCNGAIDEGLGSITCGIGACASSVPACSAGFAGRCIPRPPGEEICNGVDDDCDGETDEEACPSAGTGSGGPGDDAPPDGGCGCRSSAGDGSAGAASWLILVAALCIVSRGRGVHRA